MPAQRTLQRIAQLDRLTEGRLRALIDASGTLANWRLAARIEAELGIECAPETVRRWRQELAEASSR